MENSTAIMVLALVVVAAIAITVTVPIVTGAATLSVKKEPIRKIENVEKKYYGTCVCSYVGIPPHICELNPYCTWGAPKGHWKETVEKIVKEVKAGKEKEVLEKGWKYGTCNCKTPIYTSAGKDVCRMTPGCYLVKSEKWAPKEPKEEVKAEPIKEEKEVVK